jgi:3'-5' exoribonuclease
MTENERIYKVANAMDCLRAIVRTWVDEPYLSLCLKAVDGCDRGYGGAKHHHAYLGGLAVHVAEVVKLLLKMANPQCIDLDVLLTAACWHDHGKLREYELKSDGSIGTTPYAKEVGHVVGSVIEFMEASGPGIGVPYGGRGRIVHCMLAHHGRREWGSPVEPATAEAWLLHAADMLSSRGGVS